MDPRENILRLINEDNPGLPYPVTLANVALQTPVANAQGATRNSSVVVQGVSQGGYSGQVEVHFNRIPLNELFATVPAAVRTQNTAPTIDHLIERINATYGLTLQVADVTPPIMPTYDTLETTQPVEVAVVDTSWNWMGTVSVDLTYGNPLLDAVVIVRLMPLLRHPVSMVDLGSKKSGYLCTYNFDFTGYLDQLVIDPITGRWQDFNKVQAVGKLAGLTWWYNSQVLDFPTSAIPDANPAFERVMVQTYGSGNVLGPIYFHYDLNW